MKETKKNGITSSGVWTWGHVIYDYRGFFDNMHLMGLDKIVIWNDFAPLNAREVMDYAHSRGIKVIWGFAWGWIAGCDRITCIDDSFLGHLKDEVIERFETQYRDIAEDGIYFQSFTEVGKDTIGGRYIAEAVTTFVNSTARALYEKYPELEIEFGLHATSVKTHLDMIAQTDQRIRIVWEDCGAFPYAYDPNVSDGFDETLSFTEKLLNLRGEGEKCGIVVKGMTTLDWSHFSHMTSAIRIGEYPEDFIVTRAAEKEEIWNQRAEGWKKNSYLLAKTLRLIEDSSADVTVEGLIEDGMLEHSIPYPAALYSAIVNNPYGDSGETEETAKKLMNSAI